MMGAEPLPARSLSSIRASLALGLLLLIGGCTAGGAVETMSVACEPAMSGFPAMSLVYEGDESGTLKVSGEFGEMTLPATKSERTGEVDGEELSVTGIQAFGQASVLMPERTAIEACIAGQAKGDAAQDPDMVMMFADSCRREAPMGTAPVPITAKIEIATLDAPDIYAYFVFIYEEKSDVPGEHITIESLPPPSCVLAQPE